MSSLLSISWQIDLEPIAVLVKVNCNRLSWSRMSLAILRQLEFGSNAICAVYFRVLKDAVQSLLIVLNLSTWAARMDSDPVSLSAQSIYSLIDEKQGQTSIERAHDLKSAAFCPPQVQPDCPPEM